MLLSLLKLPIPNILYSIGVIEEKIDVNLFKIRFEDVSVMIYTKEQLKKGDWIRFYGTKKDEVIICNFVQILYDFDPKLLIRCIKILNS